MPFRVDLHDAGDDVFDRLVELDAIDVERSADGAIAALLPDRVSPREIAAALGRDDFAIAPARGRDAGSLWILHIRPFRVGGVEIVPVGRDEPPGASQLDAPALVRRVGRRGHLVLSGIPLSLEHDVDRRFRNLGMRRVRANSCAGWIAMVVQASW